VFVERSWKNYKNEQAKRRIHRIGQHRPVSAIYLVTENALDDRITKVLAAKTNQQRLALSSGQLLDML
jgi:SNF2 family DNA or RNA helicase